MFFENGLQYHKMASGYKKNFVKDGYFNVKYIPDNFWVEVLSPPPFTDKFPFFNPKRRLGFGFFWASPLFLLFFVSLIYFGKRAIEKVNNKSPGMWMETFKVELFIMANLMALFGVSFIIFCVMGPGWQQFGSRYSLDYQLTLILPIVLLSSKLQTKKWYWVIFMVLLVVSIYMNYFGAWYFNQLYIHSSEFWLLPLE